MRTIGNISCKLSGLYKPEFPCFTFCPKTRNPTPSHPKQKKLQSNPPTPKPKNHEIYGALYLVFNGVKKFEPQNPFSWRFTRSTRNFFSECTKYQLFHVHITIIQKIHTMTPFPTISSLFGRKICNWPSPDRTIEFGEGGWIAIFSAWGGMG